MHQPLPTYWLFQQEINLLMFPAVPERSYGFPCLCILQRFHDDFRNAFCPPICHMVSFLVMFPVDLLHIDSKICCTGYATPFFHQERIVFWIFPCSPYFLPKEKYPFIHVSATQLSPHSGKSGTFHFLSRLFCQVGQLSLALSFFCQLSRIRQLLICVQSSVLLSSTKSLISMLFVHLFFFSVHSPSPAHSDAQLFEADPRLCHDIGVSIWCGCWGPPS